MKALRSTAKTQGHRENDFSFTEDGELLYRGFECDKDPDGDCGCLRDLVGAKTCKGTTTMEVVEVDQAVWIEEVLDANERAGWIKTPASRRQWARMIGQQAEWLTARIASFRIGAILERRGDLFQERAIQ